MTLLLVPAAPPASAPRQHVPRTTRRLSWPVLPPTEQGGSVLVVSPLGLHVTLSRLASDLVSDLSLSTASDKICRFLSEWFEHLAERGDVWELMMQPREIVQRLFCDLLKKRRYRIKGAKAAFKITRKEGNLGYAAYLAATIRGLYDGLGGAYPEQNPFERVGWRPADRITYKKGFQIIDAGNAFTTDKREWAPPQNYDTIGIFERIVAAGSDYGWPPSVTLIARIMGESGGRFCDTSPLTYADWAAESFGRGAFAPNKASKGERVKTLCWSSLTQQMLEREVAARHAADLLAVAAGSEAKPHPSLEEAREMAKTPEGLAELAGIPLLPSSRGRPYKRSCFASHWFRPAMKAGGVMMPGKRGFKVPTPHWLRHFNIEEDLRGMPADLGPADVEAYEEAVLDRKFLKTNQLKGYAAHQQHEKVAKGQRDLAEQIGLNKATAGPDEDQLPPGAMLMAAIRGAAA